MDTNSISVGFDKSFEAKIPQFIGELEVIVEKNTPDYISLTNPKSSPELLEAHYLLAELYGKKGDNNKAKSNLEKAVGFYSEMAQAQSNPNYMAGIEGKKKEELLWYRKRLMEVAAKIGADEETIGRINLIIAAYVGSQRNITKIINPIYPRLYYRAKDGSEQPTPESLRVANKRYLQRMMTLQESPIDEYNIRKK